MKIITSLISSCLLLIPSFCLATPGGTMLVCGKVKQTLTYKNKKKNINYRYFVIEEFDSFDDGEAGYDRQLPYGLHMFKAGSNAKSTDDCFEIDMRKNLITSSAPAG